MKVQYEFLQNKMCTDIFNSILWRQLYLEVLQADVEWGSRQLEMVSVAVNNQPYRRHFSGTSFRKPEPPQARPITIKAVGIQN